MRSDDHDEPSTGSNDPSSEADDDGLPVGGRARPARRYLAIGELLETLRPEFPDLTLSKIRFLEQQGLLEPERTPSGYRKFFSGQVERLWWILDQQREGYVPLKEIRQRLAAAESAGILSPLSVPPSTVPDPGASVTRLEPRTSALVAPIPIGVQQRGIPSDRDESEDADHDEPHDPSLRHAPKEALGESRHPSSVARRVQQAFAVISASADHPAQGGADQSTREPGTPSERSVQRSADAPSRQRAKSGDSSLPPSGDRSARQDSSVPSGSSASGSSASGSSASGSSTSAAADSATTSSQDTPSVSQPKVDTASARLGSANPLISQYTGASFTFDELVRASGLEPEELRQLESFGLIAGHSVLGALYFDEDALIAARAAQKFKAYGIEPRHMRIYRTMADRESGFLEQIVSPLVHRRQESARNIAADQLEDLIALGTQMRLVALRRLLRASLDGR